MTEQSTVSFNIGHLQETARDLAGMHEFAKVTGDIKTVQPILDKAKGVLDKTYRTLSRLAKEGEDLSSAAEWLIDNYYIIQEQIVQIPVDFPKEYQRTIPALQKGELQKMPRVYELVLNYLNYTDNVVDTESLSRYLHSYQEREPLMQGEIWAIPIMIRLNLIEKLAEKASRILLRKRVRREVGELIEQIKALETAEPGVVTGRLSGWMNRLAEGPQHLYLIEIYNALQAEGLLHDEQKRWVGYRFRKFDLTLEEAMRIEAQQQSRIQVSIQNAVVSLREVSEYDWSEFVEANSLIDQILRLDPAGVYPEMDAQTRDSYRKVVERLSRRSRMSEPEVAESVLLMSERQENGERLHPAERLYHREWIRQHVGYWLVGEGYQELAARVDYSMPVRERMTRFLDRRHGLYISAIGAHTLILLMILWVVTGVAAADTLEALFLLLIAFFPALDLSVSAVNRFFAFFLPPRVLPKMSYKSEIPDESRTLVVVPTMITSPADVRRQAELLEIRSLANPNSELQFVLLSDFTDADKQVKEKDKEILKEAGETIAELNQKYSSKYGDRFFLLHRERIWNESEHAWMGWERKRGKLEEFNRLLVDPEAETSYRWIEGDFISSISSTPVQFVITLDADTKLPPDSARHLIRTIAHPLNSAWYDPDKGRIAKGYGVIQPRISIPPESARRTWFTRIFSGNVGIDPYSTAVSDIYQDLAGEAVFTGKGIYHVHAFHKVLDGRFPENRILSHDLIESTYLRAGLATDIELFDDYPPTYDSFSKRNHRWTRGDWQIASWLLPRVPEAEGKVRNPINLLSKWKIFDNLRRSLNPFFLTLFFIAGWFWLPGAAWLWTLAAFGILAFPIYVTLSSDILNRPARVRWKLYWEKVRSNLKINTAQALFTLIILPHQAIVHLDAILRSLYRMIISKRWLLEWTTASLAERNSFDSPLSYLRSMVFPVLLGLAILAAGIWFYPAKLWIFIPFFLLWSGSPIYLWKISRPIKTRGRPFTREEEQKLKNYARRTWFLFERFINEEHSWLPPDNYQEDPPLRPVARTSPTNIGLALTSTQVAYNMGYITFSELLDRLERMLSSMEQLERYRGHFYNWYETRLGEVLSPRYISTVDSGNLAACLIVVKQAVRESMNVNGINRNIWSGLNDTILTIDEIFTELKADGFLPDEIHERITFFTGRMREELAEKQPAKVAELLEKLQAIKKEASSLSAINLMPVGSQLGDVQMEHLLFWLESPLRLVEKAIAEYRCLGDAGDVDPSEFSPSGICNLTIENGGDPACSRMFERWSRQVELITGLSEQFVEEMDFSFLYLENRDLFSIGYNVEKSQLDKGTYDLLASEARIASYIAIAKGDVPVKHWFRLSRRLTSIGRNEILLSWGGTMFEYLMPLLFLRSWPETLMSNTYENVLQWQREYGDSRNRPWGFSESAYNFLNLDMHYQYQAFGAPGLGLKRGLAEEYVVAPYASMLSLMVNPSESLKNIREIEKAGGLGLIGFYDAIDYTPGRLNGEEGRKVVKTYMAHHHGMSLLALENILNGWSLHHYFHSDPRIRSSELILQEKVPRGVPIKEPHPIDVELEPGEKRTPQQIVEHAGIDELDASPPRLHMLSNGKFSTFVTHAGTGQSKVNGVALNGWEPDPTADPLGLFFYIRDLESGKFWSAMHQPVRSKPDRYDTWFHNGKIVTSRVDDWMETTTEICVSPDQMMELRKLKLTNYAERERTIEITSYAEVVLNRREDHVSHPAFSKLFVQTDYLPEHHAVIARRRPRSEDEKPTWLVHTFAGQGPDNLTEPLQFETERANFIGRGRTLADPLAMESGYRLPGALGNVTDPVVSLRTEIRLKPGETVEITFGLGKAGSREEAEELADQFDNRHATNRVFDLATVYSSVELNHLGITSKQAHDFQKLASWLLYADNRFRGEERQLRENRKQQPDLWAYGVSGDFPLIVFRIDDTNQMKALRKLIKAHAFWRMNGLETELLILNDHPPGYIDEVQEAIHQAIEMSTEQEVIYRRGGVFVHRTDKMPEADLTLVLAVAHVVFEKQLPDLNEKRLNGNYVQWRGGVKNRNYEPLLGKEQDETASGPIPGAKKTIGDREPEDAEKGSGEKEIEENEAGEKAGEKKGNETVGEPEAAENPEAPEGRPVRPESDDELQIFNGFGGFNAQGDEYHIVVNPHPETGHPQLPPAPWINVIANPDFGFIVSERGGGYTWSENSRENKLTAWSNDPVVDPVSEAFYIRDEQTRRFWSPTPGPVASGRPCKVVHGFGYTEFHQHVANLEHRLTQFVPREGAVKISMLDLTNHGPEEREISIFRYLEQVLGIDRNVSSRHIVPNRSSSGSILYTVNPYNNEFAGRTAFATVPVMPEDATLRCTTDRTSFLGRNQKPELPKAICCEEELEELVEPGIDPCAAFQVRFTVMPGESVRLIFLEGEGSSKVQADQLIQSYSEAEKSESELREVKAFWKRRMGRVRVSTPEPVLDLLVNGWLTYQNISCRMWARTAFYQAGGAFGYRDQLQDSLAALYTDPEITRNQILLHAKRQFREGDVLHWWHPPTGRGIRSRITDDRLWLPYAVWFYLESTGDDSILHEQVPWISARHLEEYEHEVYLQPEVLDETATVFEHCARAIEVTLKFGKNGLPLMGGGDWNDGMNRVGEKGEGESVWLGFFLYSVLLPFAGISQSMKDTERASQFRKAAADLKKQLNSNGWDGEWYLRAFYDDGTPLGSAENDECRIDAISQAWSVISGVATRSKGRKAMAAVEQHLISEQDRLIRLLSPPFDKTEKNPGYIKGYIPGVRENGGQYTHGALWVIKAFAESGQGAKAMKYFNLINPLNHTRNRDGVMRYKVEPYVMPADVYGEPPLTGMGGWSWYTGSGGWMYRVALESILGFRFDGDGVVLDPSIPPGWPEFELEVQLKEDTVCEIRVRNPDGLESGLLKGTVDGMEVRFEEKPARIQIPKDGNRHQLNLVLYSPD